MWKSTPLTVTAIALLGAASTAAAHHSFSAVFDDNLPVELTGTVTKVEWMNPHVWFYLDVAREDGTVETWAFEMGSPNRLQRYGWHQGSMPQGQLLTVRGSRARDGSTKAAVETVTMPDGKQLFGAQDASQ